MTVVLMAVLQCHFQARRRPMRYGAGQIASYTLFHLYNKVFLIQCQ